MALERAVYFCFQPDVNRAILIEVRVCLAWKSS